jgi:hypothetical protein
MSWIAEAMRPRLDLASSRPGEHVVQLRGGRQPVGIRRGRSACRPRSWRDLGLERTDRPGALGGEFGKLAAAMVVGFGEERLAVAL